MNVLEGRVGVHYILSVSWTESRRLQRTLDVDGEARRGAEMSLSPKSVAHSQGRSSLQRNSALLLVEMSPWCCWLSVPQLIMK